MGDLSCENEWEILVAVLSRRTLTQSLDVDREKQTEHAPAEALCATHTPY